MQLPNILTVAGGTMKTVLIGSAAFITALAFGSYQMAQAQDAGEVDKAKLERAYARYYSPYAQRDFPTRPLFGETHLHTMASFDAGAFNHALIFREDLRTFLSKDYQYFSGEQFFDHELSTLTRLINESWQQLNNFQYRKFKELLEMQIRLN